MHITDGATASGDNARPHAGVEDESDTVLPARRTRFGPLWLQVLVAVVIGVLVGVYFPNTGAALKPLGDGFVMLIRMVLAPIIFGTVVVGIARMGDLHEVGRVGAKALLYFEVVSTISLIMGLVAVDILQPGPGMNVDPATLDAKAVAGYATSAGHLSFVDFLLNIIPSSVGDAFVRGNILQIILFGVAEGLSVVRGIKPADDKIMRLHAQTATIENGFVHLPTSAPWLADFLHELTVFPNGRHDDQVDSTAQAIAWTKQRSSTTGMLDYYRELVESKASLEERTVRLLAPAGIGSLYISQRNIDVPADRIVELSVEDAGPLKRAGWVEIGQ